MKLLISIGTGAQEAPRPITQTRIRIRMRITSHFKDGWHTLGLMRKLITGAEKAHNDVAYIVGVANREKAEENKA